MHTIKNVVIILIIIIIIILICMLLIESKKNIIERLSCPIGEQEGTGGDAGTCVKCPPGTFKTKTMSTCAPPDAGHFALYDSGNTNKTGSVEQVPCLQHTEDKRLAPYQSRYTHSATGAALANNAVVLANVGKCSTCPESHLQSVCKPCPAGTSESWIRGNLTCVKCPSGTYRTSSMDMCKAPDGGYRVVYDTTNTVQTGSEKQAQCPVGKESLDNITCTTCPVGTYRTLTMSSCKPPDHGHHVVYDTTNTVQTGSASQALCPDGTRDARDYNRIGGTRQTQRQFREQRNFKLSARELISHGSGSDAAAGSCEACAAGTSATGDMNGVNGSSQGWWTGFWNAADNTYSGGYCGPCPAGYQLDESTSTCTPCPIGTYRARDMKECRPPEFGYRVVTVSGFESTKTGSREVEQCTALSSANNQRNIQVLAHFGSPSSDWNPAGTVDRRWQNATHWFKNWTTESWPVGEGAPHRITNVPSQTVCKGVSAIDSGGAWCAGDGAALGTAESVQGKWIRLDLGRPQLVAGVMTQARHWSGPLQFVNDYYVKYSLTRRDADWTRIPGTADGEGQGNPNSYLSRHWWLHAVSPSGIPRADSVIPGEMQAARNKKVPFFFPNKVNARYLKIFPIKATGHCSMRVGIILANGLSNRFNYSYGKKLWTSETYSHIPEEGRTYSSQLTNADGSTHTADSKIDSTTGWFGSAATATAAPTTTTVASTTSSPTYTKLGNATEQIDCISSNLFNINSNEECKQAGIALGTNTADHLTDNWGHLPQGCTIISNISHWNAMEVPVGTKQYGAQAVCTSSFSSPTIDQRSSDDWMQINLGSVKLVSGVVTQGGRTQELRTPVMMRLPNGTRHATNSANVWSAGEWVTSFRVEHSLNPMGEGTTGTVIEGKGGNTDSDTKEYFLFPKGEVSAQYIKIYVLTRRSSNPTAMRADVLLTKSNLAGFNNVGSCELRTNYKSVVPSDIRISAQNNTLLDAIWHGGTADLFKIVLPDFVKAASGGAFKDLEAKGNFGAGIKGEVDTVIRTITDSIEKSVNLATKVFNDIERELQKQINAVDQITGLSNPGSSAAQSVAELGALLTKVSEHVTKTLALFTQVTDESNILSSMIISSVIVIFTKFALILTTLFEVDIPKFKGDKYTLTPKLNLVGIRTKHMFSKIGSLIISFSVFILIIAENRGISEFVKISKFIITNILIDTWKFIQYTIKYNLIDLLSTKPSLKNIISKKVYKDSINTITFRLIQIIRGIIHFSELFIDIGTNIVNSVDLLLETIKFLNDSLLESTTTSTGPVSLVDKIKKEIENIVSQLNPFGGMSLSAFVEPAVGDPLKRTIHQKTNDTIRGIIKTIGITINCNLKPTIETISSNVIQCKNGEPLHDYDPKTPKTTCAGVVGGTVSPNDAVTVSGDYYCSLDFIDKIKFDVDAIDTVINKSQEDLYLNLYNVSIDISKPFGWSYDENKKDIEEKIDIKKM